MITKKQKQFLKGLANTLPAVVIIGKSGLTENILDSIDEYLTAHELLKISVLNTCDDPMDELVIDILANTHSDLVSKLGRKITIYRRNNKKPVIMLPR